MLVSLGRKTRNTHHTRDWPWRSAGACTPHKAAMVNCFFSGTLGSINQRTHARTRAHATRYTPRTRDPLHTRAHSRTPTHPHPHTPGGGSFGFERFESSQNLRPLRIAHFLFFFFFPFFFYVFFLFCGKTEPIHQTSVINSHSHHRQLSLH